MVSYALWVIMTCHCGFILGKVCTILVRDAGNEGGYAWVETEDLWEIPVPFLKFSCEPYGALKVVLNFFKMV